MLRDRYHDDPSRRQLVAVGVGVEDLLYLPGELLAVLDGARSGAAVTCMA
jgi:hypothetical protein